MKKIVLVLMLSSVLSSFGMDSLSEASKRPVKVRNLKSSVEDKINLYKRIVALSPVALSPVALSANETGRKQPFHVQIAPQTCLSIFPEV